MAEQLTPERKGAIYAAWLKSANGREVAREFGVDEKTVRNVLREVDAPRKSALHTHALAKAERDARRALEKARKRLESALDATGDVKELAAVAAQIHDNARATTQMRVAHSKLTGDHAPEKHEHAVDSVAEIARRIARLAEPDDAGEGTHGPH